MPKVSIVVPCYNHGDFLLETLDSIQDQTFDDYDVIIVNDGSTDKATIELLNHLDLSRVRVIHTDNLGVSAARNRAISETEAQYILPLDADDKIAPTFLEKAIGVLESQHEVKVVCGERVMFGEREGGVSLPVYDQRRQLVENLIYPASVFRRDDWDKVGGYCEGMTYGWEDWEFWISLMASGGEVVKFQEPMFFYRVRRSSRDHSLSLLKKLAMFSLIVWRHKLHYLKNIHYVFLQFLRYFLSASFQRKNNA